MHFRPFFHYSKQNDINKITAVLNATTEIHPIDTVSVFYFIRYQQSITGEPLLYQNKKAPRQLTQLQSVCCREV